MIAVLLMLIVAPLFGFWLAFRAHEKPTHEDILKEIERRRK